MNKTRTYEICPICDKIMEDDLLWLSGTILADDLEIRTQGSSKMHRKCLFLVLFNDDESGYYSSVFKTENHTKQFYNL